MSTSKPLRSLSAEELRILRAASEGRLYKESSRWHIAGEPRPRYKDRVWLQGRNLVDHPCDPESRRLLVGRLEATERGLRILAGDDDS